jgi:hypothetical protein
VPLPKEAAQLLRTALAILALAGTGACGRQEPPTFPATYTDVSGTYLGVVHGSHDVSEGTVRLSIEFEVTLVQTQGDLSGTYSHSGDFVLDGPDGSTTTTGAIQVLGTFTGAITPRPSSYVSLFFTPTDCPDDQFAWRSNGPAPTATNGSYLTMTGPLEVLDESCAPVFALVANLLFQR